MPSAETEERAEAPNLHRVPNAWHFAFMDTPGMSIPSSDGDVAAHAVCDALLGAAAAGDMGAHFPSSDPQWKDADSLQLLARVCWLARERGFHLVNADVTIMLERPKLREHIAANPEFAFELLVLSGVVWAAASAGAATRNQGSPWKCSGVPPVREPACAAKPMIGRPTRPSC